MKRLFIATVLLSIMALPAIASVNVITGNFSYMHHLFSTQGSPLPLSMSLRYNSFDQISGQIGKGWSHSYEIYLHENSDGTLVLTGGLRKHFYFSDDNAGYVARTGDHSALSVNGDSTYTITFPNGQVYQFGGATKNSPASPTVTIIA